MFSASLCFFELVLALPDPWPQTKDWGILCTGKIIY